ncbi:MAG: hypothetical protein CM15mP83_1040 [Flavobacteriaceae bacterium]|nr:MAG: hypothetical protein CM15mP83_1040 [Flavobacteriaceae bacterium]
MRRKISVITSKPFFPVDGGDKLRILKTQELNKYKIFGYNISGK